MNSSREQSDGITKEYLEKIFTYDHKGLLIWNWRHDLEGKQLKIWNKRYAGTAASP